MRKIIIIALALCVIIVSASWAAVGSIFTNPKFHAATSAGAPLSGGLLYTYAPGTTTPKATYSDRTMATPNANPVVLDSNGDATVYMNGYYKVILKNSAGVTQWTVDNVTGIGSSVLDQVTIADYSNNLETAVTAIGSTAMTLYINDSTDTLTGNLTIPSTLAIVVEPPGMINHSTYNVTVNGPFTSPQYDCFTGSGTVTFAKVPQDAQWTGATQKTSFTNIGVSSAIDLTGGQIAFPATQSSSTNANTLDDYEEGTWTGAFVAGTSGTITMGTATAGLYTKIGRQVTVTGAFDVASVSSPVGTLTLTGFPFSAKSTFQGACAVTPLGFDTTPEHIVGVMGGSFDKVTLYYYTNADGALNNLAGYVKAGSKIWLSCTYFTD